MGRAFGWAVTLAVAAPLVGAQPARGSAGQAGVSGAAVPGTLVQAAQDPEGAGRVASLVELAVMEYADAVAGGLVVNEAEYLETSEFLAHATDAFARLEAGAGRRDEGRIAAGLDSLAAILQARGAPVAFRQVAAGVVGGLSDHWGAVAVRRPLRLPSPAAGAELFGSHCASCHGEAGRGDGSRARGMEPPPADLASELRRAEATPGRDYQVITYGIPATSMPGFGETLSDEERWDVTAALQALRQGPEDLNRGRRLALSGDAPAGRLSAWADPVATARLADPELADSVAAAWAADGRRLDVADARAVVAFLRSPEGVTALAATGPASPEAALAARLGEVDSLVAAASALSRAGDAEAASRMAVAAYLTFEGVERELRARSPETAGATEEAFVGFRAALGTDRLADARAELDATLHRARSVLQTRTTAPALAVQSFFIILREGFEAILIVGAIIAFLVKTGHAESRRSVHAGVVAALAASVAAAFVLEGALRAAPARQEVLEGITMLAATAVLFSVSYWLLSKLDHRKWETYLRQRMHRALGAGSGLALAGVAFLAVFREGVETVLFYRALVGFADGGLAPIGLGFGGGCAALALLYWGFTRFGVRIPMRPFFAVTSGVLYYMAVVFAGSGVRELQEAGVVGLTPVEGIPTVTLLGLYPTAQTLTAQGVLLLLLVAALWATFGPRLGTAEVAEAG